MLQATFLDSTHSGLIFIEIQAQLNLGLTWGSFHVSYCTNIEQEGLTWAFLSLFSLSLHCQDTIPKIWDRYSLKRNCAASVLVPTFMCLWANYIFPPSVCLFCCSKIGGPIVGIYKSLTDTWMWKLWLRPRSSFSGKTYIGISLQCITCISSENQRVRRSSLPTNSSQRSAVRILHNTSTTAGFYP